MRKAITNEAKLIVQKLKDGANETRPKGGTPELMQSLSGMIDLSLAEVIIKADESISGELGIQLPNDDGLKIHKRAVLRCGADIVRAACMALDTHELYFTAMMLKRVTDMVARLAIDDTAHLKKQIEKLENRVEQQNAAITKLINEG